MLPLSVSQLMPITGPGAGSEKARRCPSGEPSSAHGPLSATAAEPSGKYAGRAVSHPQRRAAGFLLPVSTLPLSRVSSKGTELQVRPCALGVFLWLECQRDSEAWCPCDHCHRQRLLPLGHYLLNVNCQLSGCEFVWLVNRTRVSVAPATFLAEEGGARLLGCMSDG